MYLQKRVDIPELLDEGKASLSDIHQSLEDMRRLNQWLFGVWATLTPIKARVLRLPKPLTIVDVATGSGQMAQAMAAWATREWQAVRVIGVDLLPTHLAHAQRWNIRERTPHTQLVAGNGLCLPFADQSVDIVTSSLFLHHLDEMALGQFFAECRRVARHGVVMSDLWRHWLPFTLYQMMEPVFVRSPITRYDSRASFRRAYTPQEMERIAQAYLPGATVRLNLPSFRWILEWWNNEKGERRKESEAVSLFSSLLSPFS
jgi:ubiquinone/menaquinone biosynthesis C-methylase UbiE